MRIVLVGAGRLATSLAPALLSAGHEIAAIYSRTQASAQALASTMKPRPTAAAIGSTGRSLPDADIYIFSLTDAALTPVLAGFDIPAGAVCLHTAGSVPMELFRGHAAHYGVLYPMQTFSKERPVAFKDIPCFVEWNDDTARQAINALAGSISGNVQPLSSEGRRSLHLAAVFACNFPNHCYALAAKLLESHGVDWKVMRPLVEETTHKAFQIAPRDAQTGPAVRGDMPVIEAQRRALQGNMREIYELMSRSIINLNNETK